MRPLLIAALALSGCFAANDVREAPLDTAIDTGPEGEGELDRPRDTGDTGDTGLADTSDTGGLDTGPEPEPVDSGEACYLGPDRDFAVCLPVGAPAPMPAGYDYPAPLNGSPQYLAPLAYLDLDGLDEGTALAPNFALGEFAQAWKGRYGVVQPHAIERMQAMRDALGALVVNSGYRSPEYNAGVGGATWSRHMYGDAFDIDPVSVSLDTLRATCEAHGAGYVGVYTTHIHCDWRDDPLSVPFFGSGDRASRPAPKPAHDATILRQGRRLTAPATGWDEGEPLREWRAFSATGALLAEARGESFEAPPGAVRVTVRVGMAIERSTALE